MFELEMWYIVSITIYKLTYYVRFLHI